MIRSAMKDNTNKILSDLNMTLAALEVRDYKVKNGNYNLNYTIMKFI